MSSIESVGGIGSIALSVEGVQPNDVNWVSKCVFARTGDKVKITITDVKPGGRTYRHVAVLDIDTFTEISRLIGDGL